MAWDRNKTGSNIPASVKRTVRDRQHGQCNTIDPTVCTGSIDEFDHIVNVKATGQPRRDLERDPDLLQGLCAPCHGVKVQAEAAAGRFRRSGRRRPRPHPSDALRAPDAQPPAPHPKLAGIRIAAGQDTLGGYLGRCWTQAR